MIRKLLARFRKDERGNFAVLYGLSAIPLVVGMGMGIDFYTRLSYKARYDAAADAACIAALNTAQAYMVANASAQQYSTLFSNAQAIGLAAAAKVFRANSGTAASQVQVTPTFTLTQQGTQLKSTTTYSGSMNLVFGPIIGIHTAPISSTSAASLGLATYTNYYVLVDTSGSMGIGDTVTDMQRLYTATAGSTDGGSCVFGCHGHYTAGDTTSDHEAIAHNANPPITLRIDSARTAVQNMITQAQTAAGNNGNIKVGLYTMVLNSTNGPYINTISSPSTNFAALTTAANSIDLSFFVNNNSNDPGWSDMRDAVTALAAVVPTSGNGLTPSTPINYAFIISDGLQDMIGNCDWSGHCTGPISLASCQALQAKATVGTIYTTYLPIYNNNNSANGLDSFYSSEVGPYASQLAPSMQACASSSSLFFQADNGPALIAAVQNLFAATNRPVALMQ